MYKQPSLFFAFVSSSVWHGSVYASQLQHLYMQCSGQNFTIAGGIASVSDCSTVNSCHNPPQFVFCPSQCTAKLTNLCTKVVEFSPVLINPHDLKQVAAILNNIHSRNEGGRAVDSL